VVGKVGTWLADTGASVDAIDQKYLSQAGRKTAVQMSNPVLYETAASTVTVNASVPLQSKAIGDIDAVLLSNTPAVISVGKRCMEMGYGFHWEPYQAPTITHPDGTKVQCVVENNCPYVVEEGGVMCPNITGGTSSTSSSSRDPGLRDDDQVLAARGNPSLIEGASAAPSILDSTPKTDDKDVGSLTANKDNIPLMQLEAMLTHHLLTHTPKSPYCPACQRAKLQQKTSVQ